MVFVISYERINVIFKLYYYFYIIKMIVKPSILFPTKIILINLITIGINIIKEQVVEIVNAQMISNIVTSMFTLL